MGDGPTRRRKLLGLALALRSYGDERQVMPRLQRLKELGWVDEIPTRIQRMLGAIDMMRFFIVPCAADYYRSKGINFYFHTLLRFLDDPSSLIDPTGFNSGRDTIIGHVLQVVHANPDYDLQLLDSFPDGLHAMEEQILAILGGTHPRAASLLATVEDPEYHARLLDHVREFRRRQPTSASLVRENILGDAHFRVLERTFGELPRAMRYFSKLPRSPLAAARHLLSVREFPLHLAEALYSERPAPPEALYAEPPAPAET
ncbi:hypothetical protein [Nannocystis bainbridge]|uniref:Uncharacterized protein n=1 Tax=Nannocystis bainbridge TaxID=2995303 RepID=A0ABT5DRW9_9BACT|nr:hypothetical protein [Nannocystis bainbridge]MDC0716286.1 hypothetical protein [Nannocystis bainbridge]